MPEIISVSKIDFANKPTQNEMKEFAKTVFGKEFDDIERMLESFDNAQINFRNFCMPLDFFTSPNTFKEKNDLYIKIALKYSVQAIEKCLSETQIDKSKISDIIFISTTGISTPSIDALIVNEMKLNHKINRMPLWGLGCAGGVAGFSKAACIAKANPEALVLVVAAELCSLTFLKNDLSKSNFIATGLFSDGIAAALIKGDDFNYENKLKKKIIISDSQSMFYYDSLDVMGWDILNEGFKVVFAKSIPSIISSDVRDTVLKFLDKSSLRIDDLKNFIFHPGGAKVIDAYLQSLEIQADFLSGTKKILRDYGNMSSATVLYVLDYFFENGFDTGCGLMTSLGPGFTCELMLLNIS